MSSLQEIAELRQGKLDIEAKFREMCDKVRDKELEMAELEEKSRVMLIDAQKDAHECIKYFKGVALQA